MFAALSSENEVGLEREDQDKIFTGVVVTLLGRLAGLVNGFFLFAIPGLMGDKAYGAFVVVYFCMELLGKLLVAGFFDAVTYFGARCAAAKDEPALYRSLAHCFTWPLLGSLVLIGLVFLGAPFAYEALWAKEWDAELVPLLRWGSLVFPLMVLVKLPVEAVKIHMDMKWGVLVVDTVLPLANFVLILVAWQMDLGAMGLVWAYLGGFLFALPLSIHGYSRYFSIKRTLASVGDGFRAKEITNFAGVQGANMLLSFGLGKVDTLMLSYWFGPGVISVYSRLTELPRSIRLAKTAFVGVFAPLVARYKELGNVAGLEQSLHIISRWTSGLSFPLLFAILAFYPEIIAMNFDAPWPSSLATPWLLTVGPMFSCFFGLAGNLLLMTGHSRVLLLNAVLSMTLNVVLNLLLIPIWGPVGAATATMFSGVTISMLQLYELAKLEKIHFAVKGFIKPLTAGVPTSAVIFALNVPGVHHLLFSNGAVLGMALKVAAVLACAAVYAATIYLWPGDNPERNWVDERVRKVRGLSAP